MAEEDRLSLRQHKQREDADILLEDLMDPLSFALRPRLPGRTVQPDTQAARFTDHAIARHRPDMPQSILGKE